MGKAWQKRSLQSPGAVSHALLSSLQQVQSGKTPDLPFLRMHLVCQALSERPRKSLQCAILRNVRLSRFERNGGPEAMVLGGSERVLMASRMPTGLFRGNRFLEFSERPTNHSSHLVPCRSLSACMWLLVRPLAPARSFESVRPTNRSLRMEAVCVDDVGSVEAGLENIEMILNKSGYRRGNGVV